MIAGLRKISWYLVVRLLLFSLVIGHRCTPGFHPLHHPDEVGEPVSALEEPELAGPGDRLAAGGGAQFPVGRLGLSPDGVG
jgi:hypothetical protein